MPKFRSLPLIANKKAVSLDHERLLSLINNMADGVIAIDEKARVVICNSVALDILNANSLQGQRLADVLKMVDKNNKPIDIQTLVLSSHKTFSSREWKVPYSDGSYLNLYFSASPVHLGFGAGGQRGYVILLRDITREKSLEDEREEFISVAGHELRTPIAVAEGSLSNLLATAERNGLSPNVKQSISTAYDQIVFLGNLINDLSMLSRAERGKLHMTVEAIDTVKLAHELINVYRPQALKKNLTLDLRLEGPGQIIYSSQLYVREILQNFVTNALKYTDTGGLTLIVKPAANGVVFQVKDTGIGISKSDRHKLFTKFFRSDNEMVRKTSGSGLGLYVTAKLSRLINARIDVESQLNKGSLFSIFIPNLAKTEQASLD